MIKQIFITRDVDRVIVAFINESMVDKVKYSYALNNRFDIYKIRLNYEIENCKPFRGSSPIQGEILIGKVINRQLKSIYRSTDFEQIAIDRVVEDPASMDKIYDYAQRRFIEEMIMRKSGGNKDRVKELYEDTSVVEYVKKQFGTRFISLKSLHVDKVVESSSSNTRHYWIDKDTIWYRDLITQPYFIDSDIKGIHLSAVIDALAGIDTCMFSPEEYDISPNRFINLMHRANDFSRIPIYLNIIDSDFATSEYETKYEAKYEYDQLVQQALLDCYIKEIKDMN